MILKITRNNHGSQKNPIYSYVDKVEPIGAFSTRLLASRCVTKEKIKYMESIANEMVFDHKNPIPHHLWEYDELKEEEKNDFYKFAESYLKWQKNDNELWYGYSFIDKIKNDPNLVDEIFDIAFPWYFSYEDNVEITQRIYIEETELIE